MRGRSYTPSPPRGYGRRGRSPPPRGGGRYGRSDGKSEAPTSVLVRNLRHDCRPDDLKRPFGQFGPVKDIYLPRDYYSGNPRGFGFVQYVDPADAAEAKYHMDGQILQGRELTVVFAEENRKKPTEMRTRESGGRERGYHRKRSPPPHYSRSPRYSRSPPPRYGSRDHPPPKRRYSRSVSPREKRYSREMPFSRSPSPEHSPNGARNRRGSPVQERLPRRSQSPPGRGRSPVRGGRSPSRSRSRSPYPEEEEYAARGEASRRVRSPPSQ